MPLISPFYSKDYTSNIGSISKRGHFTLFILSCAQWNTSLIRLKILPFLLLILLLTTIMLFLLLFVLLIMLYNNNTKYWYLPNILHSHPFSHLISHICHNYFIFYIFPFHPFSVLFYRFHSHNYFKSYICITFHLLFYMIYSHNCFTPYILQPSSPYRLHGPTAWGPGDTKRPTGHGDHPATPAFSTRGIQLEIQFENNFVASSNNIEIHWKIKGFWPHVLDYKQELMTK